MHPWQWFETKMLGYSPRKMSRRKRLVGMLVACLMGIALGLVLTISGIGTGYIASGMSKAGYDISPLMHPTLPPSAAVTVQASPTPQNIYTPTPHLKRGGWINP